MYLAKLQSGSRIIYQIRQSFQTENKSFQHRIIYELGESPSRFIEPFQDHIVLFNSDLIDAVSVHTKGDGESEVERLLWDFLPPETRSVLSRFRNRRSRTFKTGPLSHLEKEEIFEQIHLFDRRRLYYLRYGAVDQSRLSRLHEKCCRPLLGQSRDEREYYFAAEEMVLEPGSYLQYVYAIFNIQKHFQQSFAPWLPEALAKDEMGDHFLTELCRLNSDDLFWQGKNVESSLHHHLKRYLIMFFDFAPVGRSFLNDFAKTFMSDHRKFRWPERKPSSSPEKISKTFDTPFEELVKMTREQLSRLYRKKAMYLHPDRGGDHDLFIELTEVYNELLCTK